MRFTTRWTLGSTFVIVLAVTASADSGKKFAVTDDCAPNADWGPGGCLLDEGNVTRAEFGAANANGFPGHPAWRIDPPYVAEYEQSNIRAENTGGRGHTFTEVARFGGGFVGVLNPQGTTPAPECATVVNGALVPAQSALDTMIAPGGEVRVENMAPGTHNFQCCIHPWMRTTVKVRATGHSHH